MAMRGWQKPHMTKVFQGKSFELQGDKLKFSNGQNLERNHVKGRKLKQAVESEGRGIG